MIIYIVRVHYNRAYYRQDICRWSGATFVNQSYGYDQLLVHYVELGCELVRTQLANHD